MNQEQRTISSRGRVQLRQVSIAIFAVACSLTLSFAVQQDTPLPQADQLVDPDPAVRARARERFIAAGPEARAALLEAARNTSPAIRRAAVALIDKLPRHLPTDPPKISALLQNYGNANVDVRREILGQINALPGDIGRPVLIRLLLNEPESDATWFIAVAAIQNLTREAAGQLANLGVDRATAPQAFVAAWGLRHQDRPRSRQLLDHVLASMSIESPYSGVARGRAFDMLIEFDRRALRHESALAGLRRYRDAVIQAHAHLFDAEVDGRITEHGHTLQQDRAVDVLLHHAMFGPFPGWASDIAVALSLYQYRPFEARTLPACLAVVEKTWLAPVAKAVFEVQQRPQGDLQFRWGSIRVFAELNQFDRAVGFAAPLPNTQVNVALIRLQQYTRYGTPEQKVQAIRDAIPLVSGEVSFEAGGDALDFGHTITGAQWRQGLLAAQVEQYRQLGQLDKAGTAMDALRDNTGKLSPELDDSAACDLLPTLRAQGKNQEADELFQRFYGKSKAELDASPESSSKLNQLAWLCGMARSELDAAEGFARRAVEIDPNQGGYVDTLAVVLFEQGKIDEAIATQKRAVELEPLHVELRSRLERFENAKRR